MVCIATTLSLLTGCGAGETGTQESGSADTSSAEAAASSEKADTESNDTGSAQTNDADGNGRYDSITYALPASPSDMLPWDSSANYKAVIFCAIYDTLFDFIGGEYVPSAAKGYTVVDDLHYQVEIYDNITDWDGNPLTADDVVFCYNQYATSGYATKFTYFDSIRAVDDHTVEFTWTEPVSGVNPLEKIFCNVQLYTEKAWNEHNFATDPCGTGPYKLVEFTSGSRIVVEANDDYWQTDESLITLLRARNVDTITYDVILEASQNVVALKNGEIDFSVNVSSENIGDFDDNPDYEASTFPTNDCFFLTSNMSGKSICSDLNLRLAMYYAIDNKSIAEAIPGYAPTMAWGTTKAPDYVMAWNDQETYFNTYDPELAAQYLEQSSYDGQALRLMVANSEAAKKLAQMIQVFLENIGVNVELMVSETAVVTASTSDPDAWDLYIQGCGGTFIVDSYNKVLNRDEYNGLHSIGFINDDKLQELFLAASSADTWSDESVDAVYQYVVENAYAYLLMNTVNNVVQTTDCIERYDWDMYIVPNACKYNLE